MVDFAYVKQHSFSHHNASRPQPRPTVSFRRNAIDAGIKSDSAARLWGPAELYSSSQRCRVANTLQASQGPLRPRVLSLDCCARAFAIFKHGLASHVSSGIKRLEMSEVHDSAPLSSCWPQGCFPPSLINTRIDQSPLCQRSVFLGPVGKITLSSANLPVTPAAIVCG